MNPAGGVWARWPMGTGGAAGALSAISETAVTKNPNSRRSALDASSADVITSAYPGSIGEPQARRPPHNAKRVGVHVGQKHTRTRSIRVVESPARPLPGRPSDPFRVVSFRRQRGVVSRASPDAGALLRAPRGVDDVPRAGVALEPFPPRQHRSRVGVPRHPPPTAPRGRRCGRRDGAPRREPNRSRCRGVPRGGAHSRHGARGRRGRRARPRPETGRRRVRGAFRGDCPRVLCRVRRAPSRQDGRPLDALRRRRSQQRVQRRVPHHTRGLHWRRSHPRAHRAMW